MNRGKILFLAFSALLLIQCKKETVTVPIGTAPGPGDTSHFTDLEKNTWQVINDYRKSIKLSELSAATVISEQCRDHCQELAQGNTNPHDGFQSRVKMINTTLNVMSAGEVIYQSSGAAEKEMPERALRGWLKSTTHKAQVEGSFTHMGVGAHKSPKGESFITVIFVDHYSVK